MNERLALRPNLLSCALEERILPAIEFGLFPNPFFQVNLATNQIYVPGTSTSSAGINAGGSLNSNSVSLQGLGSNPPGPQWYFLMVGGNASGVSNGSSVGGSLSLYSMTNFKYLPYGSFVHTAWNLVSTTGGGPGGGGGGSSSDDSSGGSSGSSTVSVTNFGASFSSGYGFALNGSNNFGMFSGTAPTTTVGSVPVHTYSGGGDLMDAPDPNAPQNGGMSPYQPPSTIVPTYDVQGPSAKLYENLLGKNPGQMGPTSTGPAAGMGAAQTPMKAPAPPARPAPPPGTPPL